MPEPAELLLTKLLTLAETKRERQRDVIVPMSRLPGYPFENNQKITECHAQLKLAEEKGVISITWKKHFEGHEIQKVRLLNTKLLAQFLDRPLLEETVNRSLSAIDGLKVPDWFTVQRENIEQCWRSGKRAYTLAPADTDKLTLLITAINAIETMEADIVLDYRQFGARYLHDSKVIKDITRALAAVYREHDSLTETIDKDVLAYKNLVPLSHPVFITGPVRLSNQTHTIDADISPYIGVPLNLLETMSITTEPAYILTIENLSSFNEYTQTINDGGIVIYTAGFPVRKLQRFYGFLATTANVPLFHWGDTDPHGFQILKTLQRCVPDMTVLPHLMEPETGDQYTVAQLKMMTTMQPINGDADQILNKLIKKGSGLIEQETLSASSPIPKNDIE